MSRILVVDDVAVVRLVIAKILRKAGHTVVEAGDGVAALSIIESQPLDVVVSDLWMPGADGVQLLLAIRERFPALARVAMSGGSPQTTLADSMRTAAEAGAMLTLMKPIDKTELLDAIASVLAVPPRAE